MKTTDYLFCETCQEYSDLFKYGSVENAGHDKCKWRYVTEEELKDCVKDCEEDKCFDEVEI